ncbi:MULTISPECIES: integration host factor, actinobacterial type [Auritidibacter]|uniref:integration host factor, actinobacterial type n=1 Tax=Auritidibacter TaxID=1160973 RepID=UPI000D73CBB4|nr:MULTISPECIES: integration host factor, actinobacterial type [Auritidibacter]NIH70543.1 hypothetical protein [Auritidibacter ignavus]PXA81461.1 DNA-binding protein [Auritidibacter sp. NML120636]RMX23272.1 DNA-binding protein [Auritidibacter ignavus]WHS27841.1 integration host factor, actinobacterial type [Auritidibacter ignavus]WHS36212.1 integration host factor, actinobacterial type [Auritidibacter ignavus]
MVLEQLSPAERQAAREKALEARTARAELKAAFANGAITLEDVFSIADLDDAIGRMRCIDLLTALRSVGEVRATTVMEACVISPKRRLRGLGRRQREKLIAWHNARLAVE